MVYYIFGLRNRGSESRTANPISSSLAGLIVILIAGWWFKDALPIKIWDLWSFHNTGILEWLKAGLPIFIWGAGLATLVAFIQRHPEERRRQAERILAGGLAINVIAGTTEEIMFRWLIFLSSTVVVQVANFLFFGWLGFGIAEWFQNVIAGPIANFFTAGFLEQYVNNPAIWMVGAGMISANAFFRDGHKYQGWLGCTNSWFCGMFFFYMTFHYGLVSAMITHFIYNCIVMTIAYLDMVYERFANGDNEHSPAPTEDLVARDFVRQLRRSRLGVSADEEI